ncbi:hypothetical protein HDV04_002602 [Boothiomyces sp. JEL0838]|nr:hypothetical protein HDV04_002602 [Boothiomyces sp. JEL0838]
MEDLDTCEVQGFVPVQDLLAFVNRMAILEKSLTSMPSVQIYSSKYTNIILHALSASNHTLELHYDCLEKESVELLKFTLKHVQKLILRWFRPPTADFYDQLLYTPLTSLELNDMYLNEEQQTHIRNLLKLKLVDISLVNVQLDEHWNGLDLSNKKNPLQKVQLGNVNIPLDLVHQMLAYSSITELKLHDISLGNLPMPVLENLQVLEWTMINLLDLNQNYFVEILRKNRGLKSLTFSYNMFTSQNEYVLKQILQDHLHLETLCVEYDDGFDFESIGRNTSIKELCIISPKFTFPSILQDNHFITKMKINDVYDTTITERNKSEFTQNLAHVFTASKSLRLLEFPLELKTYILRKMCFASYIPRLYIDSLVDKLLTKTWNTNQVFDLKVLLE